MLVVTVTACISGASAALLSPEIVDEQVATVIFHYNIKRTHSFRRAKTSVADPGCFSRIPDPDFYPSRIPDPKTGTKERGEKK